ncbi:uncharacterized protein LOC132729062 isoform X2 [Ruditapes philippinarum]|uniref:uncharacterized protein LOC132729062 isoform X2 n=1 Tax=Ruditapes philippinarum TaxID=129788 RepID=UPI00295BE979|nr:uncharacterized protein LOC132729062 isoform X2 [Ruditapes philippinarum]
MLYINNEYNIEVQQIIKPCAGLPNAKCTCAVAISAGQDVFMINRCAQTPFFGFTQCGDGGILDVQRIDDLFYKVFTPIGTRISINLNSNSIWFNVDITMAPKDMGTVYGLCGRVDGDKSNDLTHRHSKAFTPLGKDTYNYHLEFSKSWRIEDNSDENLFQPTLRFLTPWVQKNGLYCVCNHDKMVNEALCSPTQYLNCKKTGSITKTKCHIKGRRKRQVGNHSSKEIQRILSKIAVQFGSRKKRDVVEEIVITEESKKICSNKISGIQAFTDFSNVGSNDDEHIIIQQCEFDLSVVKDTSWADVHVEAVNNGVKNMLDLQPTVVENNSEKVKTFYVNTCPMNCSNQGECVESGICSCFTYYMGPDCSIDERDGLTILDIEGGGQCDLADGEECECFYVRSENIQDNFTCNVNTSKILKNGAVEPISSKTLRGGFEDIFTGICCAPDSISGQKDVFVAQYTVSISNNGINFGNAESVYVFNSECQSISTSESGSKTFSLKDDHCFIDGYCFSEYDMAPVGCRACQSSKSLYNWTDYDPCQNEGKCSDETAGYTCTCMPGYRGINCEYEINECLSTPCQNGGVCTDMLNKYTCECPDGFIGYNCQTDIDECSSNPCKNSALCINDINMYQCNCSDGYEGTNCEQNIDECASNPCQNGGTCRDLIANFECECVDGYEGITCNTDACTVQPCHNGGTCKLESNSYMCLCVDGYDGQNCDNVVKSASGSLVTDIVQKKIKIVFHVESVISVTDPILKEDITYQLTGIYKRALGNKLKEVVILDLRIGSLVVDFEVIYVKDSSSVTDLTDANLDLIKGEKTIEVFNETVRAISVSVGNVTVTNASIVDDENVCAFFTALNGNCKGSLKCSVMKGRPSCWSELKEGDDSDLTLLIVIVVCFVLVFVIIAGVSACVGFHIIRKRKSKDKFSFRYDVNIVVNNPTMRGCNKSRLTTDSFELMPDFQDSNPSMPTEEQKE